MEQRAFKRGGFDVGPPPPKKKSVGGPMAFVGFEHIYTYTNSRRLFHTHAVPAASHSAAGQV